MLASLCFALLNLHWALAAPTEAPVLSIPVRDIIARDLSAHKSHPNFKVYTRWLESPQGSYIRRNAKALDKHPNVASIDCHSDDRECLFTSKLSFADITNSKRELDELVKGLEAQIQARDESSAAVLTRDIEKRASTDQYIITTHYKTYHDLGPDDSAAGFQHYITWDLGVRRPVGSGITSTLTHNTVQASSVQ
jgi:hypothetical protein